MIEKFCNLKKVFFVFDFYCIILKVLRCSGRLATSRRVRTMKQTSQSVVNPNCIVNERVSCNWPLIDVQSSKFKIVFTLTYVKLYILRCIIIRCQTRSLFLLFFPLSLSISVELLMGFPICLLPSPIVCILLLFRSWCRFIYLLANMLFLIATTVVHWICS